MYKKTLAVGVSLALLGLVLPLFAFAQVGVSLFPVKFIEVVDPGTTYFGSVIVSNPNTKTIRIRPEVENLVTGDQGSIDLSTADVPYGLTAWIALDRSEFLLEPKQKKEVFFRVSPPLNAEPAGYYGAILFRALDPDAKDAGVGVSGRVGTVLLVEVPGDTKKGASIDSFSGPKFVAQGPVDLSLSISNTGNVHFEPVTKIHLSGIFFKNKVIEIEPRVVFPGYSRDFTATIPNKYLYGPITASAEINIQGIGTEFATHSFWAFPWQNFVIIVLVVLALIFIRREFKKRFKLVKVSNRKKGDSK